MSYLIEPDNNDDKAKFPCGKCNKHITYNAKSLRCNVCNYWSHMKCEQIDSKHYEKIRSNENYLCKKCKEEIFPFQKLSDEYFFTDLKSIDIKKIAILIYYQIID